tara:strand:- start:148069 stop:149157 length:1089 start_codon:yes stop_codon:yes gene_type:complete
VKPEIDWIFSCKEKAKAFLTTMETKTPGRYKYSFSGDLYPDNIHWNLGASVFALKIMYLLQIKDENKMQAAANYILSFKSSSSDIYDPIVFKKSFLRNFLGGLKRKEFNNFFNKAYISADTRQSLSSLSLFDLVPKDFQFNYLKSEKEITNFLNSFEWDKPWNAGSHFSHAMFFLNEAHKQERVSGEDFNILVKSSIDWINKIQSSADGCWYAGTVDLRNKINGAMKIITGFLAVGIEEFPYANELVDTCLMAKNDNHACDNFNIVLVLNYASKQLGRNYRQKEIEEFVVGKLTDYKKYYFENLGGFSFLEGKANDRYYGAKISNGKNEPDIHGTVLFLWGISIISQILGIENEVGLKEFRT